MSFSHKRMSRAKRIIPTGVHSAQEGFAEIAREAGRGVPQKSAMADCGVCLGSGIEPTKNTYCSCRYEISDTFRGQTGQGLAEYALILALITIVVIGAIIFLGPGLDSSRKSVEEDLRGQLGDQYEAIESKYLRQLSAYKITVDGQTLYGLCSVDDFGKLNEPCLILEPRPVTGQ